MSARLRLVYFAHSLRSDWNNGNAHFLRGLLRAMIAFGHEVTIFEEEANWSIENLRTETSGSRSLADFAYTYPELAIMTYSLDDSEEVWRERLTGVEIVLLHEWNTPALARRLLTLRHGLGFKLLFHDTHHRASSSPTQIKQFGLEGFDGVLAFGEALRTIYREHFNMTQVWTLHEAADTTVFYPNLQQPRKVDVVWIGNWGEGDRSAEIHQYLLKPALELSADLNFQIYGVRYPAAGLAALGTAHVIYGGYLPNLDAPAVYAAAGLTVHIPRQQYSSAMQGIPTIRVFEALACGIPLISAPWHDSEGLFRPGDFCFVESGSAMKAAMQRLLHDPEAAADQAQRGLETVLARHTCVHRAQELTAICEELLS